jgi:hypothetical protein
MDADWAPLKFWTFFAAMHPLLQPALWISEVLHSGVWPGPSLGGLVPVSFAALNVAALGALGSSAKVRNGLNGLLLASFVGYVSTGLAGAGSPSAYNLALDDGVRGCPAYEQVAQPSMRDFDVAKYQGKWFELAFHDWTQFAEVSDTSLDIQLSQDGQRWVDDFGVKGPARLVAPRSWDKSPVANGAHYFLYGKVDTANPGVLQVSARVLPVCARALADEGGAAAVGMWVRRPPALGRSSGAAGVFRRVPRPSDRMRCSADRPRRAAPLTLPPSAPYPPPVPPHRNPPTRYRLQESGFGLTFPNFIVDVAKGKDGQYTQAIQFQCLERGGVRIFEGINFLSRTTDDQPRQLGEMHERATRAGMDPYGSSADQMHVVEHMAPGSPPVDNDWQRFWDRIGFGKLLALAEGAMHSQAEDILNKVQ